MGEPSASVSSGKSSKTTSPVEEGNISSNSSYNEMYTPVDCHWFYKKEQNGKDVWTPFSAIDSDNLDQALYRDDDALISTDGGRYDVALQTRRRIPIYWNEKEDEVRRCSWFFKAIDSRFIPYEEAIATQLEAKYRSACLKNEWHSKMLLPNGETIVLHGPSVMIHLMESEGSDNPRPRIVKRGLEDFDIEDGEPSQIDHVLFMVHGIGAACDFKLRSVEEVVCGFRDAALQLVQSHYKSSVEQNLVGRIEVLPISWHHELHANEFGIDEKLKAITLESIPRLRKFTNETLLDIFFYTSPFFCQSIIDTVGGSLNKLYSLFVKRNPTFTGNFSLAGHSLGSLIVFDLLCHQTAVPNGHGQQTESKNAQTTEADQKTNGNAMPDIRYEMAVAGTGQPFIKYPQLLFRPSKFFALGSPIGVFVTVRGIDNLGIDFKLPTCDGFYNIFHPYDAVAYRLEALVNSRLSGLRPALIPHHKGRKRMHLELQETMVRVSVDIRNKIINTFKNTIDTISMIAPNKLDTQYAKQKIDEILASSAKSITENKESANNSTPTTTAAATAAETNADNFTDESFGQLNGSKRIDYVLQESPIEFFNEYLFALISHVCYWESEDTILFIVKEIYATMGTQMDNQIPQPSMLIERHAR